MAAKTTAPIKTTASPNTNGALKTNGTLTASESTLAQFPEFPPRYDMQNIDILHEIGYVATLKRHFGMRDTTLVYGELPIGNTLTIRLGLRIPDLIIAFDCDPARAIERQGYDIDEQGKPPDFVLEIASKTTGRVDYTEKRVSTMSATAYLSTGDSTPPAAITTMRRWRAIGWWMGAMSLSRYRSGGC